MLNILQLSPVLTFDESSINNTSFMNTFYINININWKKKMDTEEAIDCKSFKINLEWFGLEESEVKRKIKPWEYNINYEKFKYSGVSEFKYK